jgi:hypothetical protein
MPPLLQRFLDVACKLDVADAPKLVPSRAAGRRVKA